MFPDDICAVSNPFLSYCQKGNLCFEDVALPDIAACVGTPFYVYSQAHIQKRYRDMFTALRQVLPQSQSLLLAYAVKANSNLAVLRSLQVLGSGADIVSLGELIRVLEVGISAENIIFSGVGKTDSEILRALTLPVGMLNVESIPELESIARLASECERVAPICLRVNPDIAAQTLPGISTGRKQDKFGIPWQDIASVYQQWHDHPYLDIQGLHCHIGSQILDVSDYERAWQRLRGLVDDLLQAGMRLRVLNLGGGIGIAYDNTQSEPLWSDYASLVKKYFGDLTDIKLVFEPGRCLVGNAGLLVSSVLYEKQLPENGRCVIIDAAMNDLMRPALYQARHQVLPLHQRTGQCDSLPCNLVGPICESTDCFGEYHLPAMQSGHMLAFQSAGAYGAVMAGQYNTRPLIPEVMVSGGEFSVVRRRPLYDDMLQLEDIASWQR